MHTQATAEVMIRLGNYRVWHPFPVSCVTNYFNKVFSSQRRGRLSKCVCALSDFICRRRMATWHTNCHGSLCVCVCVAYFMSLVKSRVFKRGQVEKSHGLRSVKSNASSQAYGWYFFIYTLSSHWFSWIYVKLHCNTSKTLAVLFVCCCWFGGYHHHPVLWWFKCLKNILAGNKLWMKVLLLFSI